MRLQKGFGPNIELFYPPLRFELVSELSKLTKWQLFSLKMTIFDRFKSENDCHFVNLLSFDNTYLKVIHQPTAQILNKCSGL